MAQARGQSDSISNVHWTLQHTALWLNQMRLVLLVTPGLAFVLQILFTTLLLQTDVHNGTHEARLTTLAMRLRLCIKSKSLWPLQFICSHDQSWGLC